MIKPTQQVAVYNSNDDAKQALTDGQIQALVVDLPTAFEITGAGEVKNSTIVGQLPAPGQARAVRRGAGQGLAADVVRLGGGRHAAAPTAPWPSWPTQWLSRAGNAPVLK